MKNVADLVNCLKDTHMNPNDSLMSFDIVNLFTRVLVHEAINTTTKRLQLDVTPVEWMGIPVKDIKKLMVFCMKSTYFRFGEALIEQIVGAAMGHPFYQL